MNYEQHMAAYKIRCEEALHIVNTNYFQTGSVVSEAAIYSLLNGGKRVRGTLVMAVSDLLGGNNATANDFAAAIEMIHAFSLIHDDLPCMDDDDLRRGKPSAHIRFGEANALLAGDMLALQAAEVIAMAKAPAETKVQAVGLLMKAAGAKGMILGQELDIHFENQPVDESILRKISNHKTGALIRAAAGLGILAAGQDPNAHPAVDQYALNIGLAFQIVDDILDVESNEETMGKSVGSDQKKGKKTFVNLLGIEKAKTEVQHLTQDAVVALQNAYHSKADLLIQFAESMANRIR